MQGKTRARDNGNGYLCLERLQLFLQRVCLIQPLTVSFFFRFPLRDRHLLLQLLQKTRMIERSNVNNLEFTAML
jgi:hypothetical protein